MVVQVLGASLTSSRAHSIYSLLRALAGCGNMVCALSRTAYTHLPKLTRVQVIGAC